MDWGPEGFCAECHTMVVVDDQGIKTKHCGSYHQKYENDFKCKGSGLPAEETPDNLIDPWENDRDPRKDAPSE